MLAFILFWLQPAFPPQLPPAEQIQTMPRPRPDAATEKFLIPIVAPLLKRWALAEELIDPRESGYVFAHPEDFYHDLGMVMQRGRDLAGVPLVADSERFPPRTMMIELLAFNRIVREHLEARRSFDPNRAEHYRKLIAECDRLYKVWDIARDASTDYYYVTVRRRALKRLREMLGDADYYGARLPDHIP